MTHQTEVDADICVVGGGMVGAAAALAASRRGLKVVLWERRQPVPAPQRLGMGLRTVALNPVVEAFLARLGVQVDGSTIHDMRIWEELGTAQLHFSAAALGVQSLGRIVENDQVVAALWAELDHAENVDIRLGVDVVDVQTGVDAVTVMGERGQVKARLLIAADGAASRVRDLVGPAPQRFDTGQAALATIVQTERAHDHTALQCFLQDGPVALLPGKTPNLSAVVWSQSHARLAERLALSDSAFCQALEVAVDGALGRIEAVDQRLSFPLVQQLARTVRPADRVILIGDAQRVLHPLAGMGVNLGFEDVEALDVYLADGGDPGQQTGLAGFARRRQVRSASLVRLMSGLQQVYGWRTPGLSWLRNTGVRWLDSMPAVKQQMLREALGTGPIAKAMR